MMDSDRGLQKVNVVLHNVAEKIKPPPEETKRERWRLKTGGWMLENQGQFTGDILSSLSIKRFRRREYFLEITQQVNRVAIIPRFSWYFSLFGRGGRTGASQKRTSRPGLREPQTTRCCFKPLSGNAPICRGRLNS